MSDDGGRREAGNVAVRHSPAVLEAIGQPGKPGPEDETGHRPLGPDVLLNRARRPRGGRLAVACLGHRPHDCAARSAAMSAFALATSADRSPSDRNALSKPFSATAQSSSKEKSSCSAACTYSSVSVVPLISRLSVFSTTFIP